MPTPSGNMFCRYGDYTHPAGEVAVEKFEVIPEVSPRGDRWAALKRMHCRGELMLTEAELASTSDPVARQLLLATRIGNFIDAYDVNGKSFGLYHGDGTPTRHFFDQNASHILSDVQIVYRSWVGAKDEYTNARTFYFIVAALFDESDSQIYAFSESIRKRGTAGEKWQWVENPSLIPIKQTIYPYTRQVIEQFGKIVGVGGWPLGNVPSPLFPAYEHGPQRVEEYDYPEFYGQQHRLFGYRWSYLMEAPTGVVAIPNLFAA